VPHSERFYAQEDRSTFALHIGWGVLGEYDGLWFKEGGGKDEDFGMSDQDEIEEWEDYESLEDRILRGPLMGVLIWTAVIAGAVWIALNAYVQIRQARGFSDLFTSEEAAEVWVWVQAGSGIAYSVFLVALGSYVLLWLLVRQSSDSHE
jgi:hypothetical protein